MPVTYESQIRARERILGYGPPGAGKSTAILSVAKRCPSSTFHVIDTEFDNYDRLLDTEFSDLKNVEVYPMVEWDGMIPQIKEIKKEVGKNDWLVVDSMTPTWDGVQEAYIARIFDEEMDEFFLKMRVAQQNDKDADGGLDGWKDWGVINKMYAPLYRELLTTNCHVYMTAEADKLGEPIKGKGGESKETKQLFGALGLKPKGQKRLGHIPQTVLLFTKNRSGDWGMNTVKDRGRVEMDDVSVGDWSRDYLVNVAGWKPVKYDA